MSGIVYREGLGRPLTWQELDGNFQTVERISQTTADEIKRDVADDVNAAQAAATSASVSASQAAAAAGTVGPTVDELTRRSYAEAGYNVVGTFQSGFTYVNANDVGIDKTTGKGYTGSAGQVTAGTNPASGGFVDRSSEVLRSESIITFGSLFSALNSTKLKLGQRLAITGYNSSDDGGYSTFEVVSASNPVGITTNGGAFKLLRLSGHSQLRDSLRGITPVIAAHRGYHGITTGEPVGGNVQDVYFVPENTAYSVAFAAKNGAWGVEGDTKVSSDGVAVVFHDDTVDRTTNGMGPVSSFTYAQLKALDAGAYVSPAFAGARIIDYDDYFFNCKKNGIVPFCEWSIPMTDTQADAFVATVTKYYGNGDGVCLYSGNVDTLAKVRLRNANIALGIQALYGAAPTDYMLDVIYRLGNGFVNLSGNVLNTTPSVVQKIRSMGLMISYAIANTPSKYETAVRNGVDIITTDLLTVRAHR